ncbi:MAG TPA: SUMF1/EgtB/PvdO family nonheme iron enzyme [Thermoanaerobaculia bacterium]|nr:SUMF1/EgtB/PvdO family nonheme iron enzyme [Thermoanaerobaculia bacterium]
MSSSDYEDFDLLILRTPEGYRARVQGPWGGVAQADFEAPFGEAELEERLSSMAAARRELGFEPQEGYRDPAREIGTRLFQAVFRGDVEVFWRRRLDEARAAGRGLRLRLRLSSPELWDWPWEYLYDPKRGFLALSAKTPVVRYVEMTDSGGPLRVAPPLRILLVTANPPGFPGLAVEQEIADLEAALAPLKRRVEVVSLKGASRSSLTERLDETFHVLHLIGHGSMGQGEGGALILEDANGDADPVSGQELSLILSAQPKLRLVVLNACEGARSHPSSPFTSVAQALVKEGIPAVVAMQFAITDFAALSFSRYFYNGVASRKPVDRAISEARHAMAVDRIPEWGTPVLVMRSPDGHLFERSRREALAAAARKIVAASSKRRLTILLLVSVLTTFFSWFGLRRWVDPNLLFSLLNPSDCPSPPGIPIAFVKIKPGNFIMGSNLAPEEEPPHEVTINRPFCISRFEVTESLWHKALKENPRHSKGGRYPMVDVSWDDAWRFLIALRKLEPTGRFRLPWEIEWEYAARADEPGPSLEAVKVYGNCGGPGILPVGSYEPNAWGLYDMLGNVSEWVQDNYFPYSQETLRSGLPEGLDKVRRGGSFLNKDAHCTPTHRARSTPSYHGYSVGFRLVREPVLQK